MSAFNYVKEFYGCPTCEAAINDGNVYCKHRINLAMLSIENAKECPKYKFKNKERK